MIAFDTATSSFLNLLINKSYRKKLTKAKIKSFQLRNKEKQKPFFVSKVLSSNPSPRLGKFRWPVMVFKLRKRQILKKKWEIANFNKMLLKFKTLIS